MSIKTRRLFKDTSDFLTLSGETHPLCRFNQLNKKRYPYLLLSSANKKNNTQYDIVIAYPQYHLILDADKKLCLQNKEVTDSKDFFETLDRLIKENSTQIFSGDIALPFTGGWFVYLAYEMAEEIEPCLTLPKQLDKHPLALASRCPAAIIYDKKNKELSAVAEEEYAHLLDDIGQDYLTIIKNLKANSNDNVASETFKLQELIEDDTSTYLEQVKKIKRYIIDGDIFQANLSRKWQVELASDEASSDISDYEIFNALLQKNPSSFAAMACLESLTIISSSPERLVSVKNNRVETRPIAGTRPRDKHQINDNALADELLAHPKEQAEHIMLIDLERNDLGRVCESGTVEVNELMILESWQHVHHIVSNVRGELQANKSPIDVIRAVFPGGTITGCPKVHCIEILAELEQQPRGAYTGSLGYINNNGSMDFNILIRTLVRDKNNSNNISFRAGGGIVSDSIAEKELEETRAKAKGLLKIFELE